VKRSIADSFWEQVQKELPLPDVEKLGYKNYSGNALDGLFREAQTLLTQEALKIDVARGIPEEYCYHLRGLCSVQRLAYMDVLKFGPTWFTYLQTDAEPSEVRLEFDLRACTLHVRVDNRPESFLFRHVSRDAKTFVNLCMLSKTRSRSSMSDPPRRRGQGRA
jgi:hypothetical protein